MSYVDYTLFFNMFKILSKQYRSQTKTKRKTTLQTYRSLGLLSHIAG